MTADPKCPKCGGETDRDSVDIGVGYQHGPWHCLACGWAETDDMPELPELIWNDPEASR